MHALTLNKHIVERDLPATREILATFGNTSGVYLYEDEKDLEKLVREEIAAGRSDVEDAATMTWDDWVDGLMAMCEKLLLSRSLYGKCVERIAAGDALREAAELRNRLRAAASAPEPAPSLACECGLRSPGATSVAKAVTARHTRPATVKVAGAPHRAAAWPTAG